MILGGESMIEDIEYILIFKIDKNRLYSYYERIANQFQGFTPIQIIAKFLNGQSIGTTMQEVLIVLEYYKDKLNIQRELLDFAFEWIRANKMRSHYLKYLGNAQFPDYEIAVDACIFLFFQRYDQILRNLFKSEIEEFEIGTLYHIFFSSPEDEDFDFNNILQEQKNRVPNITLENNRIDISLYTLRNGLSNIIRKDYNKTKRQ